MKLHETFETGLLLTLFDLSPAKINTSSFIWYKFNDFSKPRPFKETSTTGKTLAVYNLSTEQLQYNSNFFLR